MSQSISLYPKILTLQNSTSIVVPQYPINNDHGECAIYLGCEYKIIVENANRDVSIENHYAVDGKLLLH